MGKEKRSPNWLRDCICPSGAYSLGDRDSSWTRSHHAESGPDEWHAESGGKRPPEGRSGRAKRELQRGEDAPRERLSESRQVGREDR